MTHNRAVVRLASAFLALAFVVAAAPSVSPVRAGPEEDAKAALEKEEKRLRRRKELRSVFTPRERLVADAIEAFALQPIRSWENTLAAVREHDEAALLTPLRYYLLDDDWEVLAFTCNAVGELGLPELLPELEGAFDDAPYAIVRRMAVRSAAVFGRAANEAAKNLLRKGAGDDEPGVRLHAIEGLEGIRDAGVIAGRKDDPDPDVRCRALTALARLGDEKVQEDLFEMFRSYVADRAQRRRASLKLEDVGERYSQFLSAIGLGGWGREDALKLLARALLRQDEYRYKLFLSIGAAAGLGKARPKTEDLLDLRFRILRQALADRDATVRAMAARAVGFTREARFAKPLARLLSDAQVDVRHNAVDSLGKLPGPEPVAMLSATLRRERDVAIRLACLRSLSERKDEKAVIALIRGLKDKRYMVRALSARLLGRRGEATQAVRMGLTRAMRDRDYGVRENAVVSLCRLGNADDIVSVVEALGDRDAGVRVRALRGLARFTVRKAVRESEDAGGRAAALLIANHEAQRRAARQFLVTVRPPSSVTRLIAALDHDRPGAREAALSVLRAYHGGRSLGYSPKLDGAARDEAIRAWKDWWDGGGPIAQPDPPPTKRLDLDLPSFHRYARDLRWRGIDLVLAYDSTGSMLPVIRAVKQRLHLLIQEATRIVPNLRLSLFTYRDEGEEYIFYGTPLTYAFDNLEAFVQVAEANRGGDLPEAIMLTLRGAIDRLAWREEAQKVIVVIGDAPYHPENKRMLFRMIEEFARLENRGIVHALYSDPSRLGESIRARAARSDAKTTLPFLERFREMAEVGRGRAITMEDTEMLIQEILVLSFGERWREEIESRLDFE